MKRALTIAAAIVTLFAMTAADGCVRTNRPSRERHADPANTRTVHIEVDGNGPYNIFVFAHDPEKTGSDQTRDKIPPGKYTQTLDYTSGQKIEILVHVRGHRDDTFSCKIIDGDPDDPRAPGDRPEPKSGEVYCRWKTVR